MSAHDATDLSPNDTPWKFRGFQPDQSRSFCSARVFAIFKICRFPLLKIAGFHFFDLFWEDPGAPWEHPGTTEDQFGGSWGLQRPLCVEVTFQEIEKS